MLHNGSIFEIVYAALPAFVGVFFLGTFSVGFFFGPLGWAKRLVMAIAGAMLIQPGIVTDLIGLALGGLIYLSQRYSSAAGKRG